MIDVEDHDRWRILTLQRIEDALLPAFGQVAFNVGVFGEEAVLVGDAEQVESIDDQVQVRDEDGLRKVNGEILLPALDSRPKLRSGFPQVLVVELYQVRAGLDLIEKLIGSQAAEGNAADKFAKNVLAKCKENATNLHHPRAYHAGARHRVRKAGAV